MLFFDGNKHKRSDRSVFPKMLIERYLHVDSIKRFSIMTFSSFSITTFTITILSVKGLFAILCITTFCHYAKCCYAERHVLFIMVNVVMLSVVVPFCTLKEYPGIRKTPPTKLTVTLICLYPNTPTTLILSYI